MNDDFLKEDVINKISSFDDKKLCSFIVSYNYLGFEKEIAIAAANELSNRRTNGSNFQFEEYINQEVKKLPDLSSSFKVKDLLAALKQT